MKTIQLTQGKIALIDDEDYEYLNQFKWCYGMGYALRGIRDGYKTNLVFMHNIIMQAKNIDHIDGNGLNNQRSNLRIATHKQNCYNQAVNARKTIKSKSQYKGVCWDTNKQRWKAAIKYNYKTIFLGRYINELEAAKAYNEAALKYFGEYARINEL